MKISTQQPTRSEITVLPSSVSPTPASFFVHLSPLPLFKFRRVSGISRASMARVFTLAEVSEHNSGSDCWLLINGKVYDVTKFLEDHPGGDEILISSTGKDATAEFEDIGHSATAKAMMEEFYIGEINTSTIIPLQTKYYYTPPKQQPRYDHDKTSDFVVRILQLLVPILLMGAAFAIRYFR